MLEFNFNKLIILIVLIYIDHINYMINSFIIIKIVLRSGMSIRSDTTNCCLRVEFGSCPVRSFRESWLYRRIRHHAHKERSPLLQSSLPLLLANVR